MKGKLIVIEGVDGSGKATQSELLAKRLRADNKQILSISFPDYNNQSSLFVKMYLAGEFGASPGDVNPKAASTFFALDRFVSYHKGWKQDYLDGKIIIADRYVTSNMVHQASKIDDEEQKNEFLDWLSDLEYNIYSLPQPDCVVFLDMPPEYCKQLTKNRVNKATGEEKKDIHELDFNYIKHSYKNACHIANRLNWRSVNCVKDDTVRSVSDISDEIYSIVSGVLD